MLISGFGRRQGRDRRQSQRFRPGHPTADTALEPRLLLASRFMIDQLPSMARPKQSIGVQVRAGAKTIQVTDSDRETWFFSLVGSGTVRVLPMSQGRAAVILDGTNQLSQFSIDLAPIHIAKNRAHQFSLGMTRQDQTIEIGSIVVTSGQIGEILGYRTANLSGPVVVGGTTPINRIAFKSIKPGGSIAVGGDLDTLDILNGANFNGPGKGLTVGGDLNWFTAGSNVAFLNGAAFSVGRDVGLNGQPAKGSAPGGAGATIIGNLAIDNLSRFTIGRALHPFFVVQGSVTGSNRITIPEGGANFQALGGFFPS